MKDRLVNFPQMDVGGSEGRSLPHGSVKLLCSLSGNLISVLLSLVFMDLYQRKKS